MNRRFLDNDLDIDIDVDDDIEVDAELKLRKVVVEGRSRFRQSTNFADSSLPAETTPNNVKHVTEMHKLKHRKKVLKSILLEVRKVSISKRNAFKGHQ
jgi:hypothetical protein